MRVLFALHSPPWSCQNVIICLTNLSSRRHLEQIFLLRSFHPASAFWSPPQGYNTRENIALGKFSVASKCIFISNHHLFLQCTACLSGGIQQHSNTQTQDQTSDSNGLGSRYKCMCILQSWTCACQHTIFEALLFQWPIVHERTAQHPVLHAWNDDANWYL